MLLQQTHPGVPQPYRLRLPSMCSRLTVVQFLAGHVFMPVQCGIMPWSVTGVVMIPRLWECICLCCFQFPLANIAGNHRPDEDYADMPSPVENTAAQGQQQDLQYIDTGYYNMVNDCPPLHGHRNHAKDAINNYAGVAPDVPAQAQAGPPVPVSTDFTISYTHI